MNKSEAVGTEHAPKIDWSALDAMTDEELHAAALSDPDARPLTDEELRQLRPVPLVVPIRHRMRLSRESFAEQFGIPLETIRDWEELRSEPDAPARAYLRVIAREPDAVRRALAPPPALPAAAE